MMINMLFLVLCMGSGLVIDINHKSAIDILANRSRLVLKGREANLNFMWARRPRYLSG